MKKLLYLFLLPLTLAFTACESNDASFAADESFATDTGLAGSYARFIIVGNFMYIVDDEGIQTFNVEEPANPQKVNEQRIGERIESIFSFEDKLFVGSGGGLFIYQITDTGIPQQLSATSYFDTFNTFACDPVVANATHAYVTLNTLQRIETPCSGTIIENVNLLKVYDIADLTNPMLIAEYGMFGPKGLGLDGNLLFVCDDQEGLKVFDVSEPTALQFVTQFSNFTAFDVIPIDGLLLVVGPENVYQFDYSNPDDIKMIATIPYGV